MKSKKSVTLTIVLTILVGLLTIAGSFALWTTNIGNNISVSLNTADINNYVDYTEGTAVFNSNLQASSDYTDGSTTTFSVNTKNNPPTDFYASINMKINDISNILTQSDVLKITITSKEDDSRDDEIIELESDFNGTTTGDIIELLPSIKVTDTTMDYIIYVWVDENNSNAQNVIGASLDIEFWMEINQNRPSNTSGYTVPNVPDAIVGLIPVKLSDDGATVTTVLSSDPTWYDYGNKKWANAVLVTDSSRSSYQGTSGVTVRASHILAYFVWIPRYEYKVWQYTGASSENNEREIEIKFTTSSITNQAIGNGHWHTPTAFWWDDDSDGVRDPREELSGIWVSKFETSLSVADNLTTSNCNSTSCNNYVNIRSLPNVSSYGNTSISTGFYASRFMEINSNPFGLSSSGVDSHMMKNSEWGVVTYLAHSKYGINSNVEFNNNSEETTGCGDDPEQSGASPSTCYRPYGSSTNYPQSTTGNVTGVFDMAGGNYEYVMGHYSNTLGGWDLSGFTQLPAAKYYNAYTVNSVDSCTLATCGGGALNETNSWYMSSVILPDADWEWMMRGGINANSNIFDFDQNDGSGSGMTSFRIVLTLE